MKQYKKPELEINAFESENLIMASSTAFANIMNQLTETFGADASAVDNQRYENWGQDTRFE